MKAANRATLTGYPVLFLIGLSATAPPQGTQYVDGTKSFACHTLLPHTRIRIDDGRLNHSFDGWLLNINLYLFPMEENKYLEDEWRMLVHGTIIKYKEER